jgi:hypothetical protein
MNICKICRNPSVEQINKLIARGASFRDIAGQFGNAFTKSSVARHAEDCLKLEIRALIRENKIQNAIDVYGELREQLAFAKALRLAAREYLSDPATGEIVLIARAHEIDVLFEDYTDLTQSGEPRKKTESLTALLERAEKGNLSVIKTVAKHIDIRQFALNAINTTDAVIDKFAKVEGLYTKEKENPDTLAQNREKMERLVSKWMTQYNFTRERAVAEFLRIKPEAAEWLN